MVREGVPTYMGNVYEGFARQADVLLIIEGQEFPAHSQYLSSHSRLFEQIFDEAEHDYSRMQPLRLETPLER